MKYRLNILTPIIGFITSIFIWIYIQRVSLNYNSEGRFFSAEEGVIYHKQVAEVYGVIALFGVILTGLLIATIIRKKVQKANKT